MEILVILLHEIGEYSLLLVYLLSAFFFFSGLYLLLRGYWTFKRRLRITSAFTWGLWGVIIYFLFFSTHGDFDFSLGAKDKIDSMIAAIANVSPLVLGICLAMAVVGYFSAYYTFVASTVLLGAFTGLLFGITLFSGHTHFLAEEWGEIGIGALLCAVVFGAIVYYTIETYIIMLTALIGSFLITGVIAFHFFGNTLTTVAEIKQNVDVFAEIYDNVEDLRNQSVWDMYWLNKDTATIDIPEVTLANFDKLIYRQVLSFSFALFLTFIGINFQFRHYYLLVKEKAGQQDEAGKTVPVFAALKKQVGKLAGRFHR